MNDSSRFVFLILASFGGSVFLLWVANPEIAYLGSLVFAVLCGRFLGAYSGMKISLMIGLQTLAAVAVLFNLFPVPFDRLLLAGLPWLLLAPLVLGWVSRNSKRLHAVWLFLIGILILLSSNAPMAIGSQRVKIICGTILLAVAAIALRKQLQPWYRALFLLLPWLTVEIVFGLDPDTLIVFWTFPVGFLFSFAAFGLALALPGLRPKVIGASVMILATSLYAFVWFDGLVFSSSFIQPGDPYKLPYSGMEKLNALGDHPLESYANKTVYVDMWGIHCAACRPMFPEIEKLHEEYANHPRVAVVTLTSGRFDKREKLTEFVQEQGLKFPVLYDAQSQVAKQLNVSGIPSSFFALPDGRIVDLQHGFNPNSADMYWAHVRDRLREFSGD